MAKFTTNQNLYKWSIDDTKQTTITESSNNADKIDAKLEEFDEHKAKSAQVIIFSRATNLSIANNTDTNFLFNYADNPKSASFAVLNEFGQIKFVETGLYLVTLSSSFLPNSSGVRSASFNGYKIFLTAVPGFNTTISQTLLVRITSINTIKDLVVYQNSGSALDSTSIVSVHRLGDA